MPVFLAGRQDDRRELGSIPGIEQTLRLQTDRTALTARSAIAVGDLGQPIRGAHLERDRS
jgi:hypothetical protein